MNIPELLAPAGSPDALKAAVYAGADAVYLGGKLFGARAYAANFDRKQIEDAISFAHSRGVRVYVTVNTLQRDADLAAAADYLRFLSDAGADAVLIQDAGLLSLAREVVPDLPLHASTQMTITNEAGVEFAAAHGISRIVLAREAALGDVTDLCAAAKEHNIGIEIFVHGALCYCYSGQCLFSSAVGGRSGNNGMCAQPCRKAYTLMADGAPVPTKGNYILSTKDICLYPCLKEVCESGVSALKIEGRMKTPEYVAVVTSIYRKALDAVAAGTFEPQTEDMEHLAFAFNRGFTKGYLMGDKSSIMNYEKPNNRGVYAGYVSALDKKRGKVVVKIEGPVPDTGDGLVFKFAGRETGFALNKEPFLFPEGDAYKIPAPEDVLEGSELWITNRLKTSHLASVLLSKPPAGRIPIDIVAAVDGEGHLVIIGNGKKAVSSIPFMEAKEKPVTAEAVETQLRKTGGTPFFIRSVQMEYDGTGFLPMGVIADTRRAFLAECAKGLLERGLRKTRETPVKEPGRFAPAIPEIFVYTDSVTCAKAAHSAGASVYYEGFEEIYDIPVIYKLPRIIAQHDLMRYLQKIPASAAGIMTESPGVSEMLSGVSRYGGIGLNITNARSAVLFGKSCRQVALSPELSGKEIKALLAQLAGYLHPPKTEVLVQGSLEVMITENCIPATAEGCRSCSQSWALKDKTGRIFRIRSDADCRTHILNSAEICLIEHVKELADWGVNAVSIDARGRSPEYIRRMVAAYKRALAGESGKMLKEEIRELCSGGITSAHFQRGISRETCAGAAGPYVPSHSSSSRSSSHSSSSSSPSHSSSSRSSHPRELQERKKR